MINRPSYAQRTLEMTRQSLQRVPSDLQPIVSGVVLIPCNQSDGPVQLHRWRRKATPHGHLGMR